MYAQPTIVPGGVLNSASFAKNPDGTGSPVAPGSLVTIFGTNLGDTTAVADTIPYSTSLGGLTVSFNGIPAPMVEVVPAAQIVNVQVPFGAFQAATGSGQVQMTVNVGSQSTSQNVTMVPSAPGIFTLPPGVGTAVLVNLTDYSIAAPAPSVVGYSALASHPIPRGTSAFFYATGLGQMTPTLDDGAGLAANGTPTVNANPIVWIGGVNKGVTVPIIYAGESGYPGVYQVNISIPTNAPTGDNIDLQLQSPDGTQISPAVAKISIQ
jgi:uncharacterized protein (TIGR03437 family)